MLTHAQQQWQMQQYTTATYAMAAALAQAHPEDTH